MAAGVLISVANASMAAIVLPDIQAEFGVTDDVLSWFVAAYLIPFATGTLVYGRLADMRGTKPLLIFGIIVFGIGSLLVAASPTYETSIAARVLQGAGGTAIPALSMATIVHTTSEAGRARAIAFIIVAVGVGFGIGPLLGGTLAEWIGWQGPFLVTGAAVAVLVPVLVYALPAVHGTPGQRFDYVGAILLAGAVTGGVIAVNRLPNDIVDAYGVAGAAAFAPLMGLFALRTRQATEPFIDPVLFRNFRFLTLCVVGLCIQGAHFGVVVMLPLLLERYHDMRIIDIGFHLLPGALVLAATGVAAAWLAPKLGPRPILVIGSWLFFNAAVVYVFAGAGWSPVSIAILYALVAGGYAMVNSVVITAATGQLPQERTGVGVGVFNIAFFMGGALAVAMIGAILRMREDAFEPWVQVFQGAPVEFSDAGIVVLVLATLAFLLTVALGPEQAHQRSPVRPEAAREMQALLGRQKPNKGGPA